MGNENENVKVGSEELCPFDRKKCIQYDNINQIKSVLSDHGNIVEKVSQDMEILSIGQSKLEETVRLFADSVDKVWRMSCNDKIENIGEHSEFKVGIANLGGEISKVRNESKVANLKQNLNSKSDELDEYKSEEKIKKGFKLDIKKGFLIFIGTTLIGKVFGLWDIISKFF